jgi:hypothetical protein
MRTFLVVVLAVATLHASCNSEHELEVQNKTNDTLFIFGTHGGLNVTTGWYFVEPRSTADVQLGSEKPDDVHFYFNHPRNADGSPGRFPGTAVLKSFSCTWEEAEAAAPLVVTNGDPPCGVRNVSPP